MAWPFLSHPTLADYLCWAMKNGCQVQTGYTTSDGYTLPTARIVASDEKRWVSIVGTKQSDRLVMSTVARYDRRLGLKSEFFNFPGDNAETNPSPT